MKMHRRLGHELFWAAANTDFVRSFFSSRLVVFATIVAIVMAVAGSFAPFIAPYDPFDLTTLDLADSELPPGTSSGDKSFLLGTDSQGRDVLSAMLYGLRISLLVGLASVALSMIVGTAAGLIAGYFGGLADGVLMRFADVILSFPTVLIALLINGIALAVLPPSLRAISAPAILILSIAINEWVKYARVVRATTMVERSREYVKAARVLGLPSYLIIVRHVLPNVMSPVLVLATINLATAILTEATLSFLGVGMPSTTPSLGTLIRIGNEYLFSGAWWVVVFPTAALAIFIFAINTIGDWLRDALNPKLTV